MVILMVDIADNSRVGIISDALKLMGAERVYVQTDDFESIPGLPYTMEERLTSIQQAEEDYKTGNFVSQEQMRTKHPNV